MRAVVQRVSRAQVVVAGEVAGEIDTGLLVLVAVLVDDTVEDAKAVGSKIAGLRIFRDYEQRMNRSVSDVGGSILVVSQFTLAGDVRKGRRPSFVTAAEPSVAEPLVDAMCDQLAMFGVPVARGVFGADMEVSLVNDGPVTVIVESHNGAIV